MKAIEFNSLVRQKRIDEAKKLFNEEKSEVAIQKLMNLKAVSYGDEVHTYITKKKMDKFQRDARNGSYNAKWMYGKYKTVLEFKATVQEHKIIRLEYGMEGEGKARKRELGLELREITATGETKCLLDNIKKVMMDNLGKVDNSFLFKDLEELTTYGYVLAYKLEAENVDKHIRGSFGYTLTMKVGEEYKSTTYIDKKALEECNISYKEVIKKVVVSMGESIGKCNNKKIVFNHLMTI